MNRIAAYAKSHWYLPLSLLVALIGICIHIPTGEDIVNAGWDTFFTLIIIMLSYTGLEKERAFMPVASFLSALRQTYVMLLLSSLAAFILGAVIGGYASAIIMVPMTLSILRNAERSQYGARSAGAITVAAVLGSMALPSGSIANMYIAPRMEGSFMATMLPLSISGLLITFLLPLAVLGKNVKDEVFIHSEVDTEGSKSMRMLYICMMIIAAFTAMGSFFWFDILILFIVVLLIFDRKLFLRVNWAIPVSFMLLSLSIPSLGITVSSPAAAALLSELLGSTAAVLFIGQSVSSGVLYAVNVGSLGLISGMAALGVFARMGKERKAFASAYLLISIPVIAILTFILMFV